MSNKDFINLLSQKIDSIPDFPVRKSLAVAQACLESGFGKHAPGFNMFGYKWYSGCGRDYQLLWTYEYVGGQYIKVQAKFRKYNSLDESLEDYAILIGTSKRYALVRKCTDYICAAKAVKAAGYATGITYDKSIINVIEKYKLYELDYKMNPNEYITRHFQWKEFYCKGKEPPEIYWDNIRGLAVELEKLREAVGRPIRINSGWRCAEHNALLGGARTSQHLTGKAADIKVALFNNKNVSLYACRYTNLNGIGIGLNYTHLDTRSTFTIWYY